MPLVQSVFYNKNSFLSADNTKLHTYQTNFMASINVYIAKQ